MSRLDLRALCARRLVGLVAGVIAMSGGALVARAQPSGDAPKPVGLVLEAPAVETAPEAGVFDAIASMSGTTLWVVGTVVCGVVAAAVAIWLVRRARLRQDPVERTLAILARAAGLRRGDVPLLRRLARAHPDASASTLLLSESALREACVRLTRSDAASSAAIGQLRGRLGV